MLLYKLADRDQLKCKDQKALNKRNINKKLYRCNSSKGFTLAEVLITIAIIGVVAALTIPTLVTNVQEDQFKIAYKKAYSEASQALQSLVAEDELVPTIMYGDLGNRANYIKFMNKFNVVKQCDNSNYSGCWAPNETVDAAWGLPFASLNCLCFVDNAGRVWCESSYSSYFMLDTNCFKGPNQFGKDRSVIWIDSSNQTIPQIRSKLTPFDDFVGTDMHWCPAGKCYYTSWLTGAN